MMTPFSPQDSGPEAAIATVVAEHRLIDLMVSGQGTVTANDLQSAAFAPDALVAAGILERVVDRYRFTDPTRFVPHMVAIHWVLPGMIVGGLSAASFHGVSVAPPGSLEITLPAEWTTPPPPTWEVRVLPIPHDLLAYGVTTVRPLVGADLVLPMYGAAVAVAQVLVDPAHLPDYQQDCVARYWSAAGSIDAALEEAARRYGVTAQLQHFERLIMT